MFDAANRFLLAVDLGLDRVLVYAFDARTGRATPHAPPSVAAAPGAGPRHLAFAPNGRFAFVINELDSTIATLAWSPEAGTLTPVATVSTLPRGREAADSTAEIAVHPTGRFVYGSNRGHDSLAVFRVGADGRLTLVEHESTRGQTPRNFVIDPTGRWLLAANQGSNTIAVSRINQATGALDAVGSAGVSGRAGLPPVHAIGATSSASHRTTTVVAVRAAGDFGGVHLFGACAGDAELARRRRTHQIRELVTAGAQPRREGEHAVVVLLDVLEAAAAHAVEPGAAGGASDRRFSRQVARRGLEPALDRLEAGSHRVAHREEPRLLRHGDEDRDPHHVAASERRRCRLGIAVDVARVSPLDADAAIERLDGLRAQCLQARGVEQPAGARPRDGEVRRRRAPGWPPDRPSPSAISCAAVERPVNAALPIADPPSVTVAVMSGTSASIAR